MRGYLLHHLNLGNIEEMRSLSLHQKSEKRLKKQLTDGSSLTFHWGELWLSEGRLFHEVRCASGDALPTLFICGDALIAKLASVAAGTISSSLTGIFSNSWWRSLLTCSVLLATGSLVTFAFCFSSLGYCELELNTGLTVTWLWRFEPLTGFCLEELRLTGVMSVPCGTLIFPMLGGRLVDGGAFGGDGLFMAFTVFTVFAVAGCSVRMGEHTGTLICCILEGTSTGLRGVVGTLATFESDFLCTESDFFGFDLQEKNGR